MKKIKVFGQQITRKQAIEIVFGNITRGIEEIECCEFLSHILLECNHWQPLNDWSDKKLASYIDDWCEEEDLELVGSQS